MFGLGKKKVPIDDAIDAYIHHSLSIIDHCFPVWFDHFSKALPIVISDMKKLQSINIKEVKKAYTISTIAYGFRPAKNLFGETISIILHSNFKIQLKKWLKDDDEWMIGEVLYLYNKIDEEMGFFVLPQSTIIKYIVEKAGIRKLYDVNGQVSREELFLDAACMTFVVIGNETFWKDFSERFKF
jgi:hypothetical protein